MICTSFTFLNQNDPEYLAALNGSPQEKQDWEDEYGEFHLRPGKRVDGKQSCIEETEEEYGGWLIDLSKVPEKATHLLVYRS
jgi:hypothetical protein